MVRRNSVSFRLSLAAVLFGLYALCTTGGMRAGAADPCDAEQCAAVSHMGAAAFDANPWTTGYLQGVSHLHIARAFPRASAPTYLFKAASVVTPDVSRTTLARENVLALGAAVRTPGSSRAPPSA